MDITKARLAVALAPGLPFKAWQSLKEKGFDAETFMVGGMPFWKSLGLKPRTVEYLVAPPWEKIEACLSWQEKAPHRYFYFAEEPHYPELLRNTQAPPKVLFLQGRPELLHRPQMAIVGSRNPTTAGREWAKHFASELARLGWVITSGLAVGIDGIAHQGALEAKGQTIAILGSGLECIYPQSHRRLSAEIAEQGLLVSEHPPDTQPLPTHFPARNRIISGLAVGVLVIEATLKSGSLITARRALDEGRQVYALPGSLHSPLSKGCHFLIKEGAKLVETVEDILEETGGFAAWYGLEIEQKEARATHKKENLEATTQQLLDAIDFSPTTFNAILARTDLTVAKVSVILMALELKGLVRSSHLGYERV